MASYPVIFDIQQQEKYDRVHVAIRIGIIIILSIIAGAIGWIFGLLYLAVPILAAILIAQKGAQKYFDEAEQNMVMWLRWIAGFYAYLYLLTDRLPNQELKETMRFEVTPQGEPSPGGVLLRIILAIPHAIVLALIGIVAFILAIIAAIMILIQEKYPEGSSTSSRRTCGGMRACTCISRDSHRNIRRSPSIRGQRVGSQWRHLLHRPRRLMRGHRRSARRAGDGRAKACGRRWTDVSRRPPDGTARRWRAPLRRCGRRSRGGRVRRTRLHQRARDVV
jgi:hypothetical protein